MSRLDPDNCPHCGVSWVGDPVPDCGGYEARHFTKNVVLVLDEPQYYRCTVCEAKTELGIWNRGYKPGFLAEVFMRGFKGGPKPE